MRFFVNVMQSFTFLVIVFREVFHFLYFMDTKVICIFFYIWKKMQIMAQRNLMIPWCQNGISFSSVQCMFHNNIYTTISKSLPCHFLSTMFTMLMHFNPIGCKLSHDNLLFHFFVLHGNINNEPSLKKI